MEIIPEKSSEKKFGPWILPYNTGLFCYANDSRNGSWKETGPCKSHPTIPTNFVMGITASKKETRPCKSHLTILANFVIEMTPKMPPERRLDLLNLSLQ